MLWKCAHCDAAMKIPKEQLTDGWSFVRCHACQGFTLLSKKGPQGLKVSGLAQGAQGILARQPKGPRASLWPKVKSKIAVGYQTLKHGIQKYSLSILMGAFAVMSISSAVYFWMQYQQLNKKMQQQAKKDSLHLESSAPKR